MNSAIIANGSIETLSKLLPSISSHDRIVAVDGGLIYCHEANIKPDLLVGDFDSCPPSLLASYQQIPRIELHPDKDRTDLEVAIEEELHLAQGSSGNTGRKIKRDSDRITLFGAWGRRIDHSLTNALILGRYPNVLRLETETELAFAIHGMTHLQCQIGQTLSLVPLYGPAKGISTSGLKWELNQGTLDQNFIGISNICLKKEISISILEGSLLCLILSNPSF